MAADPLTGAPRRPAANAVSGDAKPTVLVAEKLGEPGAREPFPARREYLGSAAATDTFPYTAGIALLKTVANVDCSYDLTPEELCAKISLVDALIVRSGTKVGSPLPPERAQEPRQLTCMSPQVTREVFEASKGRLRVVGRAGVGIDNVDLQAATEVRLGLTHTTVSTYRMLTGSIARAQLGCLVVNAPTANTIAAAEHAIALICALARNVAQADASMKARFLPAAVCLTVTAGANCQCPPKACPAPGPSRRASGSAPSTSAPLSLTRPSPSSALARRDTPARLTRESTPQFDLLTPFPQVGSEVARRAKGLGMKVIAFDPYAPADRVRALGAELVSLDDALARGDFFSLHMPLTPTTQNLFNKAAFDKMKKGVRASRLDLSARRRVAPELAPRASLQHLSHPCQLLRHLLRVSS